MKPSKKILLFALSSLVLFASSTVSRADDLFTGVAGNGGLCCFNVDLQKVNSAGTVISDSSVTDYMKVTVSLTDSATAFVDTGSGQHPGFGFSLSGDPTITAALVTPPATDWTNSEFHDASVTTGGPAGGVFDYYWDNPSPGGSLVNPGPLVFIIHSGSEIGYSSFIVSAAGGNGNGSGGGNYFVADIMSAAGSTGLSFIGTPGVVHGLTPEPSSLLLLGTGIVGMAGLLRRRMKSAEGNKLS